MQKINCGGFYIDVDTLRLFKDDNGNTTLGVIPEVLEGIQGAKGDKGDPFTIAKIYHSIDEMNADHDNENILVGEFVLIESGTDDGADDGKLYVKDDVGFDYITNLTGAQGIKGEQGDTGVGVPHGGSAGQVLMKTNNEDYATHWEDITQVIYSPSSVTVDNFSAPSLTETQVQTAYNAFVAGKNVIIADVSGNKSYSVISVDGSNANDIKIKVVCGDTMIVTYNSAGSVASYKRLDGQVVEYSREYGTNPNDHGYVREWTPNTQGKVWVECGVFIKTVALSVGSNVPLPVTFEDENFHTQVTVLELGNYAATAYPSGNSRSVNVRVHDYYGTPKAVKICVECRGWKRI